MKYNTSWQTSQYEWGIRVAPHLTQTVEPIAAVSASRFFMHSETKLIEKLNVFAPYISI